MATENPNFLCRDCYHVGYADISGSRHLRCPSCNSPRLKIHPEISQLTMAHIDCDSFYATVEKRDNPELADKPVLIGGENRGVVSAACYVARMYGVKSAMPMFKAKRLCPEAVVIPPNMEKYVTVGKEVRKMMQEVTPLVEPLSIDEAFLDLSGTEKLHHACPAATLAQLAQRIDDEIGITASIGLSHNKFLAKIASDLEKPKGFAVIGVNETLDFLADKPVSMIWGVGKVMAQTLYDDGIERIGQLRQYEEIELMRRYGSMGSHLYKLCRGKDSRPVSTSRGSKSISSETTFSQDLSDYQELEKALWRLCEKTAQRMKKQNLAARTVILKLKTHDFKLVTRNRTLTNPTMLADQLFRIGKNLLENEADGRAFRLMGIGGSELVDGELADPIDLGDPDAGKRAKLEGAMDVLRDKLGNNAIIKGRSLK